jgi:alanine racemase
MSQPELDVARLTVRLDAIVSNYRLCGRLAGPAAVAGVVKADGYGLGADPIARALAAAGCDTFFVARLEEGIRLRPTVPSARIFVLDGATPDSVPALISHRLTPVLNSLAEIAAWNAASRETGGSLDAAIHFDTGMSRLGLPGEELATLSADSKKRLSDLRVVLLMSHLACADDAEARMNRVQLDRFRTALAMLPAAPASLASSGGVLLGKDFAFDLVRPGIGLYGGNVQNAVQNPFATAVALRAKVLQLRRIARGESVGYGASFRAERPSVIATLSIGYADGLSRSIGNRALVAIAGRSAPVVGRVSMDLLTVDVTDISPELLSTSVMAEIFGETISLSQAAADAGTVPYEILTSLNPRLPRHYETTAS